MWSGRASLTGWEVVYISWCDNRVPLITQQPGPGSRTWWQKDSKQQQRASPNVLALSKPLFMSCWPCAISSSKIIWSRSDVRGRKIDPSSGWAELYSHMGKGLAFRNGRNMWLFFTVGQSAFWPQIIHISPTCKILFLSQDSSPP